MVKKLPLDKFLENLTLCPRVVIELVIENSKGEIVLLKREKEPFVGSWHLPGGFILKDESISNCIARIGQGELKASLNPNDSQYLGLFENINGDPRGHLIHYIVRFKLDKLLNAQYFHTLPKDTIFFQKDFLVKLGYK